MQRIQGWVEAGNTVLAITGAAGTISRKVQGSFPSATITVYIANSVTLATIYADNTGTAKANPFTAGADGTWFFYASDGRYDIQFSGGSLSAPFTIGDVQAFDPLASGSTKTKCGPSTTLGAEILAAYAALPATGGIIDCRECTGFQAISAPIVISKPNVTLLFGASTVSVSALTTISGNNASIIGSGTTFTFPNGQAIGIQMFRLTGTFITVTGCVFDGNKSSVATQPDVGGSWNSGAPRIYYTPIDIEGATDVHILDNRFVNVSTSSVNFNNCGRVYIEGNTFVDCYMDPIFTNGGSGQTTEYVLVSHNVIKNIHYGNTVGMAYGNGMIIDASDIVITSNLIDTVDRTACKPTEGGPNRILVANNTVRNIGLAIGYPAFSLQGANGATTDAIYANNNISNCGGGGIAINGSDPNGHIGRVQIIGNTVYNTGLVSTATNPQGIQVIFGDVVLIAGNLVDTVGGGGIRVYDSTDVHISDNLIRQITVHPSSRGDGIDIAGVAGSLRLMIANNTIQNTDRDGIFIEDASTNIVASGNYIASVGGNGIETAAATGKMDILNNDMFSIGLHGVVTRSAEFIANNYVSIANGYGYNVTNPHWLNNAADNCTLGPLSVTGAFRSLDGTFYDAPNSRLAIGPNFIVPANATLHILDNTPATGVTLLLIQSGAGQTGHPSLDIFDAAGNDGLVYYPLADPSLILDRADSGNVTIQFRANHVVQDIIGFPGAANEIGANSQIGDFVIRTLSATTGLLVSTNGAHGCHIYTGAGSPNSAFTGSPGDIYLNVSGGSATTLYVKESGTNTNTGWVGK
jgi:hypothetical protein